jgi:hypothetical protein
MTYDGKCIGGPLDGQYQSYDRPVKRMPVSMSAELSVLYDGALPPVDIEIGTYTFKNGQWVWSE